MGRSSRRPGARASFERSVFSAGGSSWSPDGPVYEMLHRDQQVMRNAQFFFTGLHVALSLVGIASGGIVVYGWLTTRRVDT
jgi:hypothetical protein